MLNQIKSRAFLPSVLVMVLISMPIWAQAPKMVPKKSTITTPAIPEHIVQEDLYQKFMEWSLITMEMSLDKPTAIALSPKKVFVTDTAKRAVLILDTDGSLDKIISVSPKGMRLAHPNGVATDLNWMYVLDRYESKVSVWKTDGTFQETWDLRGSGPGRDTELRGIAVDGRKGDIYIGAFNRDKIMKFNNKGKFKGEIGVSGDEKGQVFGITGIAIDAMGNFLITDLNHRVQMLSPDGTLIASLGKQGKEPGQFNNPRGIALDADGLIYVADTGNNRIQRLKLSVENEKVKILPDAIWGNKPAKHPQLRQPTGIAIAPDGTIAVADPLSGKVTFWRLKGSFRPPQP